MRDRRTTLTILDGTVGAALDPDAPHAGCFWIDVELIGERILREWYPASRTADLYAAA